MFTQPKWFRENFALSHAIAGIVVNSLAVVLVNLDKTFGEVSVLVARQAAMTFLFTGLLVPRVQSRAVGTNWLQVITYGILIPATLVAVASVSAHWYWTNEVRNILVPFSVSIVLNSFLVLARRAGHETFISQARWFVKLTGFAR